MQRDNAYLLDILTAAEIGVSHLEHILALNDFLVDVKCQDAVIRRLEIIGETSGRISNTTKLNYLNCPGSKCQG